MRFCSTRLRWSVSGTSHDRYDLRVMTDTDLVAHARFGDATAFGELVIRHHAAVYRTALAIVRSPADAEDVTQDAWLQALTHLTSFRGTASVKTWLIAIVRNRAISHYRAARRRMQRDASPVPTNQIVRGQFASSERSPEDTVVDRELRQHVARGIDALPIALRQALRLVHSDRYTYEEIGIRVGAPTGTVKSRVSEARRLVKRRLQVTGVSERSL